ncbi:unnamed protein product [Brugia pahangi]|uniref:Uncharacterized protein n=1 Tax=Brugia pahangi TaxID=6280 RepID=A0A0N4SYS5_BRUPA|nr:unnamed protein product [Brugia pahangi]
MNDRCHSASEHPHYRSLSFTISTRVHLPNIDISRFSKCLSSPTTKKHMMWRTEHPGIDRGVDGASSPGALHFP